MDGVVGTRPSPVRSICSPVHRGRGQRETRSLSQMRGNEVFFDNARKLETDMPGVYFLKYLTTLVRCIRQRGAYVG